MWGSRRAGWGWSWRRALRRPRAAARPSALVVAGLIALGIGLHNFGEGLAIGAAFALGEAALGSFLVVGFTLHNITEGIGIAAPLLPSLRAQDQAATGGAPAGKASPGAPQGRSTPRAAPVLGPTPAA